MPSVFHRAAVKMLASSKDSSEDLIGKGSAAKLTYVFVGSSSSRAAGLWAPVPCWLLAGWQSHLLVALFSMSTCSIKLRKTSLPAI